MAPLSDDSENFVHLSLSGSESDSDSDLENVSTPATPRTPRPSEQKVIQCPYDDCPKSFNRKARLTEHLRSHTNTRIFKCPHTGCTKDFLRDSHLKHHVKSAHTDVRDYVCSWDGCGKSFATGTRLRRHEAAHEGKEKWRCRGYHGCNETFRKHDTLKRHIMTVHENKRPFPCPDLDSAGKSCKSGFETAEKLRAHQRAKHDQSRFSCTECLEQADELEIFEDQVQAQSQAYFTTYAELQLHIAIVHPPTCSLCPTILNTAKELKRHLELVHDVKSSEEQHSSTTFSCTYVDCDRSFSKNGNLNVHIKTVHDKRRDFVCGETELSLSEVIGSSGLAGATIEMELEGCGKDFTSKSSLEEHIRTTHLGLDSKRFERERKRKADLETAALESRELPEQKKRKSRKGQGRKNTAMSTLTGVPIGGGSDASDDEDTGGLTGFETMLDGMIYGQHLGHSDGVAFAQHTWQFPGYAAANEQSLHDQGNDTASPSHENSEDGELFTDAEFVSAPPLDPLLLHTY